MQSSASIPALSMAGAFLLIASQVSGQTVHVGDSTHGQQVFMAQGCYACHGTVGQGGSAAPRIAPSPLPVAVLTAYVRHPSGEMPPYSPSVLSDADVADIHAYLSKIDKPDAKLP